MVAVVAGAAVLSASALLTTSRERSLQVATDAAARGLERGIGQAVLRVEAVDGYFRGSNTVDPVEFDRFAKSLYRSGDLDSVFVALRVEEEEMETFSAWFRGWYPRVDFFEVRDGERVPLREHQGPRYIVSYHRPSPGVESLLGFDFAAEETRWSAAGAAIRRDTTIMTRFLQLVGRDIDDGFLVVTPVHDPSGTPVGVAAARANVSSMLEEWVPASLRAAMELRVIDGAASSALLESSWIKPVASATFYVPGSRWTVVASPAAANTELAWATLAGLLLAGGMGGLAGRLTSTISNSRSLDSQLRLAQLVSAERLRAVEALSDFELLAENSTDVIGRHDAELTYRYVSPAIETLLGYTQQALIGRAPWEFFHDDDKPIVRDLVQELVDGADSFEVEHRVRHANGRWLWFHTIARALRDESGGLAEIQTSSRDVTDRVAQHEALREAQRETERAAAEKARFHAIVSHEIRTPLSAVAGISELLAATDLDDTQRDYADTINSAARSVVALIGDLLDMSKADVSRLRLEAIAFDLPLIISEVVRMLSPQAVAQAVSLDAEIDPNVPVLLVGDAHRIRQVVVNLVGNALKFTEEGLVTVRAIAVANPSADLARVRIEVEDNGIGIASDRLDSVFEEYEQEDDSISRRFGGSGLGLGISKQLVGLMGGDLAVESHTGKGSRFWFELDLPTTSTSEGSQSQCMAVGRAHERASVVTAMLAEGWRVTESDRVDPIRADIPLLVVAGPIAEATSHDLTDAIVVNTAARRGNAARAEKAGAAAYIGSPFTSNELSRLVRLAMESPTFVTRHDLRAPSAPLRILAADDASSNRLVVERMLSGRGHSVVSVSDGAEALAAFTSDVFDVVLLDGLMPVMNGTETTREIRRLDALSGRHTPIVALTGRVSEGERAEALAAGADMWVAKPFDSTRLYQVVEQAAGVRQVKAIEWAPAVLDVNAFQAQVGGMAEFAEELVASVRAEWSELAAVLAPERVGSRLEAAGAAAHRLKGVLALVGATTASEFAAAVESAACAGDGTKARTAAIRLEAMRREVEAALDSAADRCSAAETQPNL